jgi:hypothetical protein
VRRLGCVRHGGEDQTQPAIHGVFGRTRAEVVEKSKPLSKACDEQRPVPDQRLKVGSYLRTWLEEVARPTIRVSTYESYKDIVELHLVPGLGRIRLAKLTPADVQAFLTKKHEAGLSARRGHRHDRADDRLQLRQAGAVPEHGCQRRPCRRHGRGDLCPGPR